MESHGDKTKIQRNWKSLVILYVKDSEGSLMTFPKFDQNLGIFDIFLHFYLLDNSIQGFLYFSYVQSTPLYKLMYFSKKSETEKFRPKPLNLP